MTIIDVTVLFDHAYAIDMAHTAASQDDRLEGVQLVNKR